MDEILRNEIVTLHRLGTDVAVEIYQAVQESVDHLERWMPWCHADYSLQDAEAYVAKQIEQWQTGEEFSFAIRNPDYQLVGLCGLNQFNRIHQFANLGYWLRKSSVGRGYATSAARSLARFGLQQLNLHRIEILVDVDNHPSRRVAERAGAVFEGILRSRLWLRDRAHDALCYSLTSAELNG